MLELTAPYKRYEAFHLSKLVASFQAGNSPFEYRWFPPDGIYSLLT